MTNAILTMKIMPETADSDLGKLEEEATKVISKLGGKVGKTEREPIAFGLESLKLIFIADENLGTDNFEQKVAELEGVQSAQIVDFRRAIG
ncbi:MAG: elongation factor 1-beta [archaeon]